MPELSAGPTPQVSLSPYDETLSIFFALYDFHPVLWAVIAHRCVMSAFVVIIPRPLIVSGQIFPSFLICHRGVEGGREGCQNQPQNAFCNLAACALLHIIQTGTLLPVFITRYHDILLDTVM